jgi:hypothetical protein
MKNASIALLLLSLWAVQLAGCNRASAKILSQSLMLFDHDVA